jgi:hypothetical protein
MENGPKLPHEQPSWQDITIETVHEMLSENQLEQARQAAVLRMEVLLSVVDDTQDAINKNAGAISLEQWQKEAESMQQEIKELQKIILTIDTDTHNE